MASAKLVRSEKEDVWSFQTKSAACPRSDSRRHASLCRGHNAMFRDMPFSMAWAYSTKRANAGLQPALERALSLGWETFPLEMTRAVDLKSDVKSVWSLRKVICAYRPDIVHCHSSKAGAIGRLAIVGLHSRPKVVYTPNALAVHLGKQYVIAERALSSRTDCFAAVSEGERAEIVNYKVAKKGKISIIYPGLDTTYFSARDVTETRRALGPP